MKARDLRPGDLLLRGDEVVGTRITDDGEEIEVTTCVGASRVARFFWVDQDVSVLERP
jgi:hypothetical protein